MGYCEQSDLVTESDVEQKLIYPLLSSSEALGFFSSEIRTKSYLPPLEIDKGSGRKVGYFPDYGVFIASVPILVVEAKSPSESLEQGYKEAQLYAHELNKRYPAGVNPVDVVISCNGVRLCVGGWDSVPALTLSLDDISPGKVDFEKLLRICSRAVLLPKALAIRGKLLPVKRYRPLTMLGGPSVQNRELAPNTFARELIPLFTRYFSPESAEDTPEILKFAYVPSSDRTRYNEVLESLLKDNLTRSRYPGQKDILTSKSTAPEFDSALKSAVSESNSSQILIIGGVGAGKTFFIERYYAFLRSPEITSSTAWSRLNFNEAPASLENIEHWMCKEFLKDFSSRNQIVDFLSRENLERYFAPEIQARSRGAYSALKKSQPLEYERRLADDMVQWTDDQEHLTAGVIRHYQADRGIRVVVVFDNIDRLGSEQQLRIFQATQWFRATFKCFAITSLRDETYDRHRAEPPLDAIYPVLIFRVHPPRFLDVAKRRVHLALEKISASATQKHSYSLPSGITVTYPATKLGEYLMAVYLALFNPNRSLRALLEAIAGRDVRKALHLFTDILISGHLGGDRMFRTTLGKTYASLPEWLIIRILMRTKYRHYSTDHGYVLNLLDLDPESVSSTNFLLADCLEYLAVRRKKRGALNVEGYVWAGEIAQELAANIYTREDVLWALERLLNQGLVIADHMRSKGITFEDYVKISASGFVHLRVLLRRSEYLNTIATDCWYSQKEPAEEVRQTLEEDPFDVSGFRRQRRLEILEAYLKAEGDRIQNTFQINPPGLKVLLESFDHIRAFFAKKGASKDFDFD